LLQSVPDISIPGNWAKTKEFPFNQQLRVSGMLWRHTQGYTLFVKGAPEHVLGHCGVHHRNDAKVQQALENFTRRGYRTIAFGHKDFQIPPTSLGNHTLTDINFDGFVGMADQLRPHIGSAVTEANRAGVKVVMLTGDHVNTAGFIAKEVGIAHSDAQVADSSVLANGSAEDIQDMLKTVRVFGRVLPEHKYALLKATKHTEITAMTGDGVNDIPALVEADAGIAMGSGTDAAKDASDIVLLDNNFHTIVSAMKVGRTALANIRKMLVYLIGTSSGEVFTLVMALVLGIPVPVAAIQILWINLVTDGVSVIPLGLSPSEPRHMQQAPRHPDAPLLNVRQVTRIITMSVVMSASVLIIFNVNLHKGHLYAQTLAFLSLIVVQWANAFNVNFEYKSWVYNFIKPNKKLWVAIGFSIILQLGVFMTPAGEWLQVSPVAWRDAIVAIIVPAAAVLLAVDIHKLIWYLIHKRKHVA
jgi:Ca2+-transporting ATPase